jgi:hypothetical protein
LGFEVTFARNDERDNGVTDRGKRIRIERFCRKLGIPIFPNGLARFFDDEDFECIRRIGVRVNMPRLIEAFGECARDNGIFAVVGYGRIENDSSGSGKPGYYPRVRSRVYENIIRCVGHFVFLSDVLRYCVP